MRQNLGFLRQLLLGVALAGPAARAEGGKAAETLLPEPDEAHALETVAPAIAAVVPGPDRLFLLPRGLSQLITVPLDRKGTTRLGTFGKLVDQERHDLPRGDDLAPQWWAGAALLAERVLALEGRSLTLLELETRDLHEVTRRSVPWDLIRPPRDRGGEPTAPETAALRARFKARMLATVGAKVTGLAPLPDAWSGESGRRRYLLATQVAGFPLVLMECAGESASSCVIARQCYLEGASDLEPDSVAGIGVSAARGLVVVGDRKRRRLLVFRWHSCYHVPKRATLVLPPHAKQLTSVAVDGDDRLWIATAAPDDYRNASVFYWAKDSW